MIKFQMFDSAASYQCHFSDISTFVVSIAHYMRAYFNYQALSEGKDFVLPDDAAYLNVSVFVLFCGRRATENLGFVATTQYTFVSKRFDRLSFFSALNWSRQPLPACRCTERLDVGNGKLSRLPSCSYESTRTHSARSRMTTV
jgi:hypothetical protein